MKIDSIELTKKEFSFFGGHVSWFKVSYPKYIPLTLQLIKQIKRK